MWPTRVKNMCTISNFSQLKLSASNPGNQIKPNIMFTHRARSHLCRAMKVTQWSLSLVCVKYQPRKQRGRSLGDKRCFSRAICPSTLGPCTAGKKTFFPFPPFQQFLKIDYITRDPPVLYECVVF